MNRNKWQIIIFIILCISFFLQYNQKTKLSKSECELSALRNINNAIHRDNINSFSLLQEFLSQNYKITIFEVNLPYRSILLTSKYCEMDQQEILFNGNGDIEYIGIFKP